MTLNEDGRVTYIDYPTYALLLRNLKQEIERFEKHSRFSYEDIAKRGYVGVYRSRRGEWGEWFEHWKLEDGKLVKIKEGWM